MLRSPARASRAVLGRLRPEAKFWTGSGSVHPSFGPQPAQHRPRKPGPGSGSTTQDLDLGVLRTIFNLLFLCPAPLKHLTASSIGFCLNLEAVDANVLCTAPIPPCQGRGPRGPISVEYPWSASIMLYLFSQAQAQLGRVLDCRVPGSILIPGRAGMTLARSLEYASAKAFELVCAAEHRPLRDRL